MNNEESKRAYWDYFTSPQFKHYRPLGCTDARLQKIEEVMFANSFFWSDVIGRHGGVWDGFGRFKTPQEMHEKLDKFTFDHCIGNFYGMIFQTLRERGLVP